MLEATGSNDMPSLFKPLVVIFLCCLFPSAQGIRLDVWQLLNVREGSGGLSIYLYKESIGFPINLTVNTVDVTASAGEDYLPIIDRRITFPAGARQLVLDVTILNDTLMEPSESFIITVNYGPHNNNLTIVANIEDDDDRKYTGDNILYMTTPGGEHSDPINSHCLRIDQFCLNGGSCTVSTGICECFGPYEGPTCAIHKGDIPGGPGCDSLHCVHGTCMSNGTQASCVCDRSHTGDLCDKAIFFSQCNPNNISICITPTENRFHVFRDIYVTGHRNTSDCKLDLAPSTPDPHDGVVDWCEGYAGVFYYNTSCGEVESITKDGVTTRVLMMNISTDIGRFPYDNTVTFRCTNNYGMEAEEQ